MFCGNCGKEIIGNIKFCRYCGAEQTATVIPAANIPMFADTENSVPINASDASSEQLSRTPEAPDAASASSEQIPSMPEAPDVMGTSSAAIPKPINTDAITENSVPTPNPIPASNIEEPLSAAPSIPSYPPVKVKNKKEKKPRRERKYSLGHLVMCLAAAGVMAIAAGVFAGLYFSVI